MVDINQLPASLLKALKDAGYDPNYHRLKTDGEGRFWW
jgi:hypothetical protein